MAAVEHAVAFLADYTDIAQEAWLQLALLLHRGPDTALGSDDGGPAPAVVQRTRSAVLTCLLRIASSSRSTSVLAHIVAKVADGVAVHVADTNSLAERTTACQLLLGLAKLDADAVWLLLFCMQANKGQSGGQGVATSQSTDDKVLGQLPEYIAEQLPVIFTSRSSIDKEFLDILNFDVMRGGSFAAAERRIQAALRTQHERNHLFLEEVRPALELIASRYPPGQGPEYIWVDYSPVCGNLLKKIFPTVKIVLEDSTHLMRRYMRTLTPGHALNRVGAPSLLQPEHELNKVMNRIWVDHAGVNLLTDKTLEVHESSLKLVRRGAVSDPLPVSQMYFQTADGTYKAVRGSSKLEGYHPHLHKVLPGTGYSPDLGGSLVMLFNGQWSLERADDNDVGPAYGHSEPWIVSRLHAAVESEWQYKLPECLHVPDSSEEQFGCDYKPPMALLETARLVEEELLSDADSDEEDEDAAMAAHTLATHFTAATRQRQPRWLSSRWWSTQWRQLPASHVLCSTATVGRARGPEDYSKDVVRTWKWVCNEKLKMEGKVCHICEQAIRPNEHIRRPCTCVDQQEKKKGATCCRGFGEGWVHAGCYNVPSQPAQAAPRSSQPRREAVLRRSQRTAPAPTSDAQLLMDYHSTPVQSPTGGRSKQRGARRLNTHVDNARAVTTVAERSLYFELASQPDVRTTGGAFNFTVMAARFNAAVFTQVITSGDYLPKVLSE
ncbi:hypothetical protein COCSUDRAFT_58410 [Coccomyxa subellipsoidea C-169]|uniref:Uncharacterized protein n=1 Tax=Coccomyxa subellipsoidea (strain C-169) TaxID=574566 RepID=I0YMP8_COCSC|nr:hypothetical protein COCSUDRAFT_58410 [Coccomyxa subellipsoidea C-169]EIE19667.1 hypothetical protein COCSUDRAFT_58410 [Coccomyxa subellipsoidea C-169]|eukprot:XP_005644211.1 hypothetical protein COCSUDRAFT_58410 [Coccomyxa subellipsoidea C-169]